MIQVGSAWQDAMRSTSKLRLPSENRQDADVSRVFRKAR
jgi:hypothetical protein